MPPVEVSVRHIRATCACGSSLFHPPHRRPYGERERFVCAGCNRELAYGALLDQIGDLASGEARAALARLRHR